MSARPTLNPQALSNTWLMMTPGTPFQEGDKVRLKSGGPVMTVRVAPQRIAYCIWYVDGRRCQGTFEQEGLVRVEDDTIPS